MSLFKKKKDKDFASDTATLGSGITATNVSEIAKKEAAKTFAKPQKYDRNLYEKGKAGEAKKILS